MLLEPSTFLAHRGRIAQQKTMPSRSPVFVGFGRGRRGIALAVTSLSPSGVVGDARAITAHGWPRRKGGKQSAARRSKASDGRMWRSHCRGDPSRRAPLVSVAPTAFCIQVKAMRTMATYGIGSQTRSGAARFLPGNCLLVVPA